MSLLSKLAEIKRRDDRRPGFRGEHLITFARTLGTSFIARSAAGRDGVRRLVR
jgi:hypothetical protein